MRQKNEWLLELKPHKSWRMSGSCSSVCWFWASPCSPKQHIKCSHQASPFHLVLIEISFFKKGFPGQKKFEGEMSWGLSSAEELVLSLSLWADIWLLLNGNAEGRRWFAQMFSATWSPELFHLSEEGNAPGFLKLALKFLSDTCTPSWSSSRFQPQPHQALPCPTRIPKAPMGCRAGQAGKFNFCLTAN